MEEIRINFTSDAKLMDRCAALMAASDPWLTLGMTEEICRASFEGPGKEVYVAIANEKILGFMILQMAGSLRGYLQTLFVNKDLRGSGIGKQLLQFCEERIRKVSPNIFLCVSEFNHGAAKLYYDYGFELVGELKNFVREGYTELLLRKTVGPIVGYQPPEENQQ